MTTYHFTDDDRRLIVFACGRAIEKLREYKTYYANNCEEEELAVCIAEIAKHKRMMERMKEAGPIPVG